jgi:hypothetical protein
MLREHCKVGMKVMFGRPNGEKTLGEVVKTNPSKCKVKTLAVRGEGRGSDVGTVWTVPYSLMTPAGVAFLDEFNSLPPTSFFPQGQAAILDPADLPLPYNKFSHGDNLIIEAIVDTYSRLSPENLTCDGERPAAQVRALGNTLNHRLKHLFMALGRPVSETVAYKWHDEKSMVPS